MVDARDIAEVAARELLRRQRSADPLPTETIEVVGPEAFTGETIARLWADVLGEPVTYAGEVVGSAEQAFRSHMPAHIAYDSALMFRGLSRDGMLGASEERHRAKTVAGRGR